jgi:transposase-like protein
VRPSFPDNTTISSPDEIQRWTARRRTALVLSALKGEMTVEEVARRHGLAVSEVEDWRVRLLNAAHNALRSRPRDEDALKDEQIRRLKQKVGELILEVDALKEALHNARGSGTDGGED